MTVTLSRGAGRPPSSTAAFIARPFYAMTLDGIVSRRLCEMPNAAAQSMPALSVTLGFNVQREATFVAKKAKQILLGNVPAFTAA